MTAPTGLQEATATYRERLIDGLAASIRERGFRDTKITDVVRLARTSRRTFYEHFADRDACFLALLETTNAALIQAVAGAVRPGSAWEEQVDDAIGAYVDAVSADPDVVVSLIRELPGLGAAGTRRQREGVEAFAQLLIRLVDTPELRAAGVPPVSRPMAILIVGGMRELLAHTVERGGELREIRDVAVQAIRAILRPSAG